MWVWAVLASLLGLSHSKVRVHTSIFEESLFAMCVGCLLFRVLHVLDWAPGARMADGVCVPSVFEDMPTSGASASAAAAGKASEMSFKVSLVYNFYHILQALWQALAAAVTQVSSTLGLANKAEVWAQAMGWGSSRVCLTGKAYFLCAVCCVLCVVCCVLCAVGCVMSCVQHSGNARNDK